LKICCWETAQTLQSPLPAHSRQWGRRAAFGSTGSKRSSESSAKTILDLVDEGGADCAGFATQDDPEDRDDVVANLFCLHLKVLIYCVFPETAVSLFHPAQKARTRFEHVWWVRDHVGQGVLACAGTPYFSTLREV
jgi:hypothetical protein